MTAPNHFDTVAKEWDNNPRIIRMAAAFATLIRQHVPLTEDMRVLDFGCGTGQVGMRLCSSVKSMAMVDTSEGMLAVLRQKITNSAGRNMSLHQGNLFQADLEEDAFDLAYTLMTLHHVRDIDAVFTRFHRLLKRGGWLCIGDLEPEDGSFHGEDMEVHRGFDPQQLQRQLQNGGFEVLGTERMLVVEKPDQNGIDKSFPLFFLLARKS